MRTLRTERAEREETRKRTPFGTVGGGWVAMVLAAAATVLGVGAYRAGPANPDDLAVNRLWDEQVRLEGMDTGNGQGVEEPMLSRILGRSVKIPHTKQVNPDGSQANLLRVTSREALGAASLTGHPITSVTNPHRDLFFATQRLNSAVRLGEVDLSAATRMLDILLGRTTGKIYDGFPLLNFNRFNSEQVPLQAYSPGTLPGQYKMKTIRFTGQQEPGWKGDGSPVNIWEVDVNFFWYGQQFDSDTFLIKVPYRDAGSGLRPLPDDTLRINYRIYSLVEEDFAPTQVMLDAQVANEFPDRGSVRFPYKGEDTVWVRVQPEKVAEFTVQHTALRFFRGIYTWGWHVHPPRIQFLQFVFEIRNANTGRIEFDPEGMSYTTRNRNLSIDGIGEAAPEKKLYRVAMAALNGSSAGEIAAMLNDEAVEPRYGTWREWIELMADQRQLPPEARLALEADGKNVSDYDFVTVYANNEMYGEGPLAHTIRQWSQGETMSVRLINLDNHTHYFRNVGFGAPLNDDLSRAAPDGIFSFEIMNFKPLYGAPKVAEMQWRAGWGFRPHYSVVQQSDVFPRQSDRRKTALLMAPTYPGGKMAAHAGYRYSAGQRKGDFVFDPPLFIVGNPGDEAADGLYDLDTGFAWDYFGGLFLHWATTSWSRWKQVFPGSYRRGLVIGQETEGYGIARMCPDDAPGFCGQDLSRVHWRGSKNWPAPGDPGVPKTELRFPPFLRNPGAGGDIIPPTLTWRPFLWINPANGTLYIDPDDPSKGYWADLTYSHGRPVAAGQVLDLSIEMPRAGAQLFYQFDDLFHDNDIFSPHPIQ